MSKRLSLICTLLVMASMAFAVPAKPVWEKYVMADGSVITVKKCGDEHFHYYKTTTGILLIKGDDGKLHKVDADDLADLADNAPRRAALSKMLARRKGGKTFTRGEGQLMEDTDTIVTNKKSLVILVGFSDVDFSSNNAWTEWNDILNKVGYNKHGAPGSVHDYFLDQSNGQFNLTFDVVGPIKMPKTHYYYGDNGKLRDDIDINMAECVAEACKTVDDLVDFRDYDWNNDGEVEQVFILYAGCGENAAGVVNDSLIWPHAYTLEEYPDYKNGITLDGVTINTYACSCELDGNENDKQKVLAGLGVFCHEFSHCLGLPDLYDTRGYGLDMLEDWDILSSGNYNMGGWCPPNYSAYEREFCGWQSPIVLNTSTAVVNMKALSNGGESYKIINDCIDDTRTEYYLIENRQKTGWDKSLPGHGVLITHIYYRKLYWDNNTVNTSSTYPGVSFIPANNVMKYSADVAWPYINPNTGAVSDSLTDTSKPAAKVFTLNTSGTKLMGKPITKIKVVNGIASFDFGRPNNNGSSAIGAINNEETLFGRPATIYNLQGKKVAHTNAYSGIDGLPSGLYIVRGADGRSLKVIR